MQSGRAPAMLLEQQHYLGAGTWSEIARSELRKNFLEAWDQLRHKSSLRAYGLLALPAEGTMFALCLLTS